MNDKLPSPSSVDYDTQIPIVHPEGTVETRRAIKGEIGFSHNLGDTAVVAIGLSEVDEEPAIGDSAEKGYPTTLGNPDLDAHGQPVKDGTAQ